MNAIPKLNQLTPIDAMTGDDEQETTELRELLDAARTYIRGQKWCHSTKGEYFGLGIGGVVGVFLFELAVDPGVDELLWVVCGDLPSAHIVTDCAPTPTAALEVYCDLMDAWIDAARKGLSLAEAFPVPVDANHENAALLEKRIVFLRREVIPSFHQEAPENN